MRFHILIRLAVMLLACTIASGQSALVTPSSWVENGYIYFQLINDNSGSGVDMNETCIMQIKNPGGYTYLLGNEGLNFTFCWLALPYEAELEAGTYENKITAYDCPNGAIPCTLFYYFNEQVQNTNIPPWLKIVPGGWNPTSIPQQNGTSYVGAYITTSRSCSGAVQVDAAYNWPPGEMAATFPSATANSTVGQQANTYISLGSLHTNQNNTVNGTARASIQLYSYPSACTLLKDQMFESNLGITSP